METEIKTVCCKLNSLEHHNLRILAAKAGKEIGPFVRETLQKNLSLETPLENPSPLAGTTTLPADTELSSIKSKNPE